MPATKYRTEMPDGSIQTRTSKSERIYTHLIGVQGQDGSWGQVGYCGRPDLAQKSYDKYVKLNAFRKAQGVKDFWLDIRIIPVTQIQ